MSQLNYREITETFYLAELRYISGRLNSNVHWRVKWFQEDGTPPPHSKWDEELTPPSFLPSLNTTLRKNRHCVKSVRVWSFSGPYFPHSDSIRRDTPYLRTSPYSVWMKENTDQKNSEYGTFYAVIMASIFTGLPKPNFLR